MLSACVGLSYYCTVKESSTDPEQGERIKSRDPSGAPESNDLIQTTVQLLQL